MDASCPVSGMTASTSGASCPVSGKHPAGATCPVSKSGGLDFTIISPDGKPYPVKNMLPQMPMVDFSQILRISGVQVKKEWRDVVFFSPKNPFAAFPPDAVIADCIYKSGQTILMSFREDIAKSKTLVITVPMRSSPMAVRDYHPSATVKSLKKVLGVYVAPGVRVAREDLRIALADRPKTQLSDEFVLDDLRDGTRLVLQHRPPGSGRWRNPRLWLFVALLVLIIGVNVVLYAYSGRGLFGAARNVLERFVGGATPGAERTLRSGAFRSARPI